MTATLDERTDAARVGVGSRASAWLAVGAAVLAVVLAPPETGDVLQPGVLGTITGGELEQLVGSTWRLAGEGDLVAAGAEVRALEGGVEIRTRDGNLSLAADTRATLDLAGSEVEAGAVLVESDAPYEVTSPVVAARGRGAWRVDVTSSPRVGAYSGGVGVRDGAGEEISVGAFEQVNVIDRALGSGPIALRYDVGDAWDVRLLASAIGVDRQVARLETSLQRSYGTALQRAAFYADFVVVDDVLAAALPRLARLQDGDRFGPPAETLVAVVVTVILTERAGLSGPEAVQDILAQRRVGATWGIVLARHDLGPDSFRDAADDALRRRQEEVAGGTATPVVTGGDGPDVAGDAEAPEPAPPPAGEGEDPQPPSQPPPSSPPPPDGDDPVDQVKDTVDDAVDEITDLLEPVPGPSEEADGVGDTVRDVGDAVGGTLP